MISCTMKKNTLFGGAILVALAFMIVAAPAQAQCGSTVVVENSTNITGNVNWTANNSYVLQNVVEVKDGGVLTIDPGTCVFADANQEPSVLIVRQGGRLEAAGTASQPIVFSSANNTALFDVGTTFQDSPGNPAAGDWGGILIIGKASCNGLTDDPTGAEGDADGVPGDCEVEGVDDTLPGLEDFDATDSDGVGRLLFGGDLSQGNIPTRTVTDNDNSGTLQFVRIEYAGFDLQGQQGSNSGNELNVLTLFSVGSGTTIENVQVKQGLDDGVELFGGSVNLRNVVATYIQDDSIDYSYGWNGNAQFIVVQQTPSSDPNSDRGFEVDGNEAEASETSDYELNPRTKPNIYNITLIGDGDGRGQTQRRGTEGLLQNGLVSAFATGLDVDDAETFDGCTGDANGALFFDNFTHSDGTDGAPVSNLYDTDTDNENLCTGAGFQIGLTLLQPSATNTLNPSFQPLAGINGATPPGGGFFDSSANFRGAIPATGTPFYLIGNWVVFGE